MIKRLVTACVIIVAGITAALAQIPGNAPSGGVFANSGASAAPGAWSTPSAWMDRWCSATQGSLALRGASGWACATMSSDCTMTGAGAITCTKLNGQSITLNGALNLPAVVQGDSWYGSAAGTISALAKNTTATRYLANTGTSNNPQWDQVNLGNGVTGSLAIASLANVGANTVLSNWTNASAAVSANAWPSCSTPSSALQYTTNTGLTCGTSFTTLNTADQSITGGANFTSLQLTTGNVTIDCGARPGQYIANTGGFTITAPAADGSCLVTIENGAGAGAVVFSGFSVGTSTGDALDTTSGHKFTVSVWRNHGTSGYRIAAHQ